MCPPSPNCKTDCLWASALLCLTPQWAPYFPKAAGPQGKEADKAMRKDLFGFLLLGPASAAFMLYDLIGPGLEHHDGPPMPPYPWLRIRTFPDMPWGPDCLFEYTRTVHKEWPPAGGIPAKAHH